MKNIQLSDLLCADVNKGKMLSKGWHVRQTTESKPKEGSQRPYVSLEFSCSSFSGTVTGLGVSPSASGPTLHGTFLLCNTSECQEGPPGQESPKAQKAVKCDITLLF